MLFEQGGEVVDVIIAHRQRDLREIHGAFPNEPFGLTDAVVGQIRDDRHAGLGLKYPLELGQTNVLLGSQFLQCNFLTVMLLQILLQ